MDNTRLIVGYLVWLSMSAFVLICALVPGFPLPASFLNAENAFFILVETQIFFLLFLWPLFMLSPIDHGIVGQKSSSEANMTSPETRTGTVSPSRLMLPVFHLLFLIIVALPIIWMSQEVANMEFGATLRFIVVFGMLGLIVSGMSMLGSRAAKPVLGVYLALAFFISVCLPFIHYLTLEFMGFDLSLAARFSPFWFSVMFVSGGEGISHSVLPLILYGVVAIIIIWGTISNAAAPQSRLPRGTTTS